MIRKGRAMLTSNKPPDAIVSTTKTLRIALDKKNLPAESVFPAALAKE